MTSFSLDSTNSSSTAVTTWTITSKALPAGDLYIAIGWYRSAGSTQRTVNSIAHTYISSASVVQTEDSQTARYFFGSDPDYVAGLELWKVVSSGGTADLVLTFSDGVWSPALAIYTADSGLRALTLGTGEVGSGSSVSVSASNSSAKAGLAHFYGSMNDDNASVSGSPWAPDVVVRPSGNRRFGTASSNSTTGATQSFSVSAGNFTAAAAMEVLFAPAVRGAGMMIA